MAEEENLICKICLQTATETEEAPTCHPCKCTGTLKYVHRTCLTSWLDTKSHKKCELCHFEYKYNNVYKKSMPSELNLFIIMKYMFIKFMHVIFKVLRILFNVFLRMYTVYSLSFIYSFFFLKDESLLVDHHFFLGPILSLLLYWIKVFHRSIDKRVRELSRRTEQVTDTPFWHRGLRDDRVLRDGTISENEEVLENRERSVMLDISPMIALKTCIITLSRGIFYLSLLKVLLFFTPVVKKVLFYYESDFVKFLKNTQMDKFFANFLGLALGLLILTNSLKKYTKFYYRSKVAFIIYLNAFFNPAMIGLFIKYFLYSYLNRKSVLFDNANFLIPILLNINVQILMSYVIGFTTVVTITRIMCFYKELYRPGALYFILTSENRDPINEIILSRVYSLCNNTLYGVPVVILFSKLVFMYHKSTLEGIIFKINDFSKLMIYLFFSYKIVRKANSIVFFMKRIFVNLTFFYCKLLSCSDYFFGIKNRNHDKKYLKICPNANEIFDSKLVKEVSKKQFTEEEYEEYYLRRGRRSTFAIFYVPSFFKIRAFIIHFSLFMSFQYFINLLFRTAINLIKILENFLSLEQIVSYDVRFLMSLSFVLTIFHILFGIFMRRRNIFRLFAYSFVTLTRNAILLSFKYFIWPIFCVIFMLYTFKKVESKGDVLIYSVSYTYFTCVIIINCLSDFFISNLLAYPIDLIPLTDLIRKLFLITVIPTCMIIVTIFYENILTIKPIEYGIEKIFLKSFFYYSIILGLVLFFIIIGLKKIISFLFNWREELFLERRELLNYGE